MNKGQKVRNRYQQNGVVVYVNGCEVGVQFAHGFEVVHPSNLFAI